MLSFKLILPIIYNSRFLLVTSLTFLTLRALRWMETPLYSGQQVRVLSSDNFRPIHATLLFNTTLFSKKCSA